MTLFPRFFRVYEVEASPENSAYEMGCMMLIVKLIIVGGWTIAFVMFGLFALHESGKLVRIRERVALLLEPSAPPVVCTPEPSLQPEGENAA